jgi:hypothetical protein
VDDLTHDSMTCFRSDVESGRFNVTLSGKRPFVVVGREFRDWILVLCSSEDGLECFGTVDGFCCAGDAG